MRHFIWSLVLALTPVTLSAQDGPEAGIQNTISGQIEAFLADDFAAAFNFASPMIQQIFRNSDNFGAMVKGGYPMVWRPQSVEFLDLRQEAGRQIQRLMVRDDQGAIHVLDYEMIPGPDGWLINGVSLLNAAGASA